MELIFMILIAVVIMLSAMKVLKSIPDDVESFGDLFLWFSLKPIGGGALLGTLIDSRTSTAITSGNSASYAHGITGTPDLCIVVPSASLSSTTNWWNCYGLTDATNVTMHNSGAANTPTVRALTFVFHSVIR